MPGRAGQRQQPQRQHAQDGADRYPAWRRWSDLRDPTRRLLIAAAVALFVAESLTAGEGGRGLKYRFKSGETYVYAVNIVGELGSATQTSKGTIRLTVKSADDNQLQLTPSVAISTQLQQPASPGKKAPS